MKKTRRTVTTIAATIVGLSAAVATGPAAQAEVITPPSLADILAADGQAFDSNSNDFDVVDAAIQAVLTAKPESPVAVLADGSTSVTALLPTDGAFRALIRDVLNRNHKNEALIFRDTASLGIDTVEAVLLYHVVPGATITSKQALMADGVTLTTASEETITVSVVNPAKPAIVLRDADTSDQDPRVQPSLADINRGKPQIAHGLNRVLRPIDLP
ncbi:MAG: fasciclin domain-containing protein [Actinomycetota bacterium]